MEPPEIGRWRDLIGAGCVCLAAIARGRAPARKSRGMIDLGEAALVEVREPEADPPQE